MRYIVNYTEESGRPASITMVMPIAVMKDGIRIPVIGSNKSATQSYLVLTNNQHLVVGDTQFDFGDLHPDSLPGCVLLFPDIKDILRKWQPARQAQVTNTRLLDKSEIPTDRTFRNAWREVGGKLDVSMPHARELCRTAIRVRRIPKFAALDAEYQRADEQKRIFDKDIIAGQRQVLRDLPADPAIEACQTPDELKAYLATVDDILKINT